MELDPKSTNHFYCCIACLKDQKEIPMENRFNGYVTEIYNLLVQNEIDYLGLAKIVLCDSCIATLQKIDDFKRQCLKSFDFLRSKLDFNVVLVKEEKMDVYDEPEIKIEEVQSHILLPAIPDDVYDRIKDTEIKKSSYGLRTSRKPKVRHPSPTILVKKKRALNTNIKPKEKELTLKIIPIKRKRENAYCSICDKFFSKKFSNHVINVHATKAENNQFTCMVCNKTSKNKDAFYMHFKWHSEYHEPKCCKFCDLSFKKQNEYLIHVKSHNKRKEEKVYSCKDCGATYRSKVNYQRHILVKHQGALRCKYCTKPFLEKEKYEEHIKKEEEKAKMNKRSLICDYCGYKTKWKSVLCIHMEQYHDNAPKIICNECGKTYKTRVHFRQHQICVHLPKQYQCSNCGKKFSYGTELRNHIKRFHTNENIFIDCEICGKTLRTNMIKKHVALLHGPEIRNFKCDLCDMAFKCAGTLTKHKYTHTKTRPFQCNLCPTGYYCNEYLRKHFERTHGIIYTGADIRWICGKRNCEYLDEIKRDQSGAKS